MSKRLCAWLFVGGTDEAEQAAATQSGADVAILDLEDFTAPQERPRARELAPDCFARWKATGVKAAVRVNKLEGEGRIDLAAVVGGAPDFILLPKTESAAQIVALAEESAALAEKAGLDPSAIGLVPNIETALGLVKAFEILSAHPRVIASLLASEDMANDLQAQRSKSAMELAYLRQRFLVECRAAKVLAIDCPYTWTDLEGMEADLAYAKGLGYDAKSTVIAAHAGAIAKGMRPSAKELAQAKRIVAAFEEGQAQGLGRVELDGSLLEVPIYLNAKRLLSRS